MSWGVAAYGVWRAERLRYLAAENKAQGAQRGLAQSPAAPVVTSSLARRLVDHDPARVRTNEPLHPSALTAASILEDMKRLTETTDEQTVGVLMAEEAGADTTRMVLVSGQVRSDQYRELHRFVEGQVTKVTASGVIENVESGFGAVALRDIELRFE